MSARFQWLDALTAVTVAALLAGALWIGLYGPTSPLPMHFGMDGQPDRWGGRGELAGLIGFMALVLAATAGGLGFYAARTTDASRRRGLRIAQLISVVVIGPIAPLLAWQILSAAEQPVGLSGAANLVLPMGILAVTCLVTGAFLGRVPPNVAMGVRTPWSLKSRLAWDRSNRLFGRLMFGLGLAGLIATPLAPQPMGLWVMIAAMLGAAAWSVVESWRVWRTDPDRQPF